jgi:glycosyltransferase involved in cell wall biosynthesis
MIASIVIPAKNEEVNLERCLRSIESLRNRSDVEQVIVVDNGSHDTTVKIAEHHGCTVFVDREATVAKLRNIGAEHATGDIISFIDADMEVDDNWLACAMKHFDDKKVGCVTGLINIPKNDGWIQKIWALNRKLKREVFESRWAPSGNMIVSKDAFMEIGGFNSKLITCEDMDISNRFKENGYRIIFDKDVLVTHHGEYKTVKEFLRKETWRGYSHLDYLFNQRISLKILMMIPKATFFLLSLIMFVGSIIFGSKNLTGISILLLLTLPIIHASLISQKNRTIKYFPSLLLIWTLYYLARSYSIVKNIKDKIIKAAK